MTAFETAIDNQIAIVDAKTTSLNAHKAELVAKQDTANSVYFSELARSISFIDNQVSALTVWRGKLFDARSLGHLPDTNTKWYETWNA